MRNYSLREHSSGIAVTDDSLCGSNMFALLSTAKANGHTLAFSFPEKDKLKSMINKPSI
jgi:hypothetical protein